MNPLLSTMAGDGLLARRASDLLFLPMPASDVLAAYWESTPDRVVEAVASGVEHGVDAPFVVVTWHSSLRLALFGDVEVTSDHESLPRLNAASTGTWIERTVRTDGLAETTIRLGVRSAEADPLTRVDAGVVPAGGFVLGLTLGPFERSTPVADRTEFASRGFPPPSVELSVDASDELTDLVDLIDRVSEPGAATIDVPPDLIATVQSIAPVWQLRFDDGRTEPVDANLLLGRNPVGHRMLDGDRPVAVDCPKVSTVHLRITTDRDQNLFASDLQSRNHSWLVSTDDQRLVQLPPEEPTQLSDGAHLQIGSQVFVVERLTR